MIDTFRGDLGCPQNDDVQDACHSLLYACRALLSASDQETFSTVCSYHGGGEAMRLSKSRGQIRRSKHTVTNCSGQSFNYHANNSNNR
jgi:hypothetical protein